jgi:rod shape-determining protein MreC
MKFASSTNVDVKKNISIFILLSFVIFFLDRGDNKYLKNIRYAINDTIIYSSVILKSPFNFILETSKSVTNFFQKDNQINENKLISLENKVERLKNENISISLQLKNLKKISGEELYKYETIQVKVLLYKSNILHETIIINKGKNDGIKVGDPLIKNNILVGKILKTNFNTSHGILITNLNSRIPVRIGKNNYKAIVVGNPKSEKQLNLEFLPKEFTFEDGDYIYTTSINNIMPEGILVGQIKLRNDDDFVAEPLYDFSQLDYLTVVKFNK